MVRFEKLLLKFRCGLWRAASFHVYAECILWPVNTSPSKKQNVSFKPRLFKLCVRLGRPLFIDYQVLSPGCFSRATEGAQLSSHLGVLDTEDPRRRDVSKSLR